MAAPLYMFGPFALDPVERQLTRAGMLVELPPRLFDVLALLVARAGRLVTKDELLAEVWADVPVSDGALSVAVSRVRATLGSRGRRGAYIETVSGHGYRFVAAVEVLSREEPPVLRPPAEDPSPPPQAPHPPALGLGRRRGGQPVRVLIAAGAVGVLGLLIAVQRSVPPVATVDTAAGVTDVPAARPAVTRPAEAVEAYERGLVHLRTRRQWLQALDAFHQAITLDPTFALAYVGLADVHAMGQGAHIEAEAVIREALTLDPRLGEAYASLGFIRAFQRWDWAGAEAAFDSAAALAPGYVVTHQWRAAYLLTQRRFAEAEAALGRALTLAPESANLHADLCEVRYSRRAFTEARAACQRALALDPDFPFAKAHLFWIFLLEGRTEEAVRWAHRASIYRSAPRAEALPPRVFLDDLAAYYEGFIGAAPFNAYVLARLQAARGRDEAALDALARAVALRQFHVPFVNADPAFDGLREDARFQALMREVGLAG